MATMSPAQPSSAYKPDKFIGAYSFVWTGSLWIAQLGNADGSLATSPALQTTGGLSWSYATMANSNNATAVKASAGQIYHIAAFNNSTTIAYLKFYNKASAPTPASDTVVHKIMIPASGGAIENIPAGLPFATGIAYAMVTGIGDTDNTSVAASVYSVSIGYK